MDAIILKNFIAKFILNIFRISLPIIVLPYIYRILSPENIGEINFLESVINYFYIFSIFGIPLYGLRELSKNRSNKIKIQEIYTNLRIIQFILIFLSIIGIIFIILQKEIISEKKLFLLLSLKIISLIFSLEWINEAYEEYKFISIKTIIVRSISLILMIISIKSPNDTYIYVLISVLYEFFNNIISYFYVIKKYTFSFNLKKLFLIKYFKELFILFLMINTSMLYFQFDKVFLGVYFNNKIVAYYTLAEKIIFILLGVITTISQVTLSRLILYYNENKEEYKKMIVQIFKFSFFLIIPSIYGIMLVSDNLIVLLAGKDYLEAGKILNFFSWYLLVDNLNLIFINQIMLSIQKEKIAFIFLMICGLSNIICKLLLKDFLNVISVVIITIFFKFFSVILVYIYLQYNFKDLIVFNLAKKSIIKYLIASNVFFCIIKYINFYYIKIDIFIKIILGIIFYIIILFFLKEEILLQIMLKIKKININKNFILK